MSFSLKHDHSLAQTLAATGVVLRIGPFRTRLRSSVPSVVRSIALHYDRLQLPSNTAFCDFHVRVDRASGLHRYWHPQARFFLDETTPFRPLPLAQAYPLFEWGLNWCIAQHAHHFLMIHAGVVERNGCALLLPGEPGAGKSTLTAALMLSGWRLLSDEFALVSRKDGHLIPIVRPISLKNDSIDLIRNRFPDAIIGDSSHETSKGTVAHLKPSGISIEDIDTPARPTWIIFPRFEAERGNVLSPITRGQALLRLAETSFNYSILGGLGFEAAADLVQSCQCYDLRYGDLEILLQQLEQMSIHGFPPGD